jgi:hypothetical protein
VTPSFYHFFLILSTKTWSWEDWPRGTRDGAASLGHHEERHCKVRLSFPSGLESTRVATHAGLFEYATVRPCFPILEGASDSHPASLLITTQDSEHRPMNWHAGQIDLQLHAAPCCSKLLHAAHGAHGRQRLTPLLSECSRTICCERVTPVTHLMEVTSKAVGTTIPMSNHCGSQNMPLL